MCIHLINETTFSGLCAKHYGRKATPQILLNPPAPCLNLVVAVSCCGNSLFSGGIGKLVIVHGAMNEAYYKTILEVTVLEDAKELKLGQYRFSFQQDNNPKQIN
ncbi:hypothetical protein ILYODFUR_010055 [Ilyodon furcidens]|uniref:Galectin n=1 Tax=Ilyodon furcidens TaxID=33524 RepID=A0ABV0SJY8_9TELE